MNICIVGTGYVGLVTAACFAEMGNDVSCIDKNPNIISELKKGNIHIFEPGLDSLVKRNIEQGRLSFFTKLEDGLLDAEIVFICVGTPSLPDGGCDTGYVKKAAEEIGSLIKNSVIVVDKSTVPVGTADMVKNAIEQELEKRNSDIKFFVVSNPEFLKEGDAVADFMKPDRVIIGTDNQSVAEKLEILYAPFARSRSKFITMSVRSAEMTKYAANCMLATKISFINEMAAICEKVGADIADVRLGIGADHRIGYHFIHPGLGYGGSCFPKDVKALIKTAQTANIQPNLMLAVDEVNNAQKRKMANSILSYFTENGGCVGKTVALWGLAFKANTDDMRESPALTMIEELTKAQVKIQAYDPEAGTKAKELLKNNNFVKIMDKQYDVLSGSDILLVATEWNQFRTPNFAKIKKELTYPVIFDGRNLYSAKILTELGFTYFSIGKEKSTPKK